MDETKKQQVPLEYAILELGVREGVGHMVAGLVLEKEDGSLPELPENLPVPYLETIQHYLKLIPEKIPNLG